VSISFSLLSKAVVGQISNSHQIFPEKYLHYLGESQIPIFLKSQILNSNLRTFMKNENECINRFSLGSQQNDI